MPITVPNFNIDDISARSLGERFLLDACLGSHNLILRYSDGVRYAANMLVNPDDREVFIHVCQILAFSEMERRSSQRIHPIGWDDIGDLNKLPREL